MTSKGGKKEKRTRENSSVTNSKTCGLSVTPFWAIPPVRLGLSRRNSGKFHGKSETLSECFLEPPSRVRLGSPKPYNSRHLRRPEHFQSSLPLSTAGDASFCQKRFRTGPLRAGHGIPSSTEGTLDIFGCVIAQAFFSRGASEISLKSRVFSAELSGI